MSGNGALSLNALGPLAGHRCQRCYADRLRKKVLEQLRQPFLGEQLRFLSAHCPGDA